MAISPVETITNLFTNPSFEAGGLQSEQWSVEGDYSLRVDSGETATVTVANPSTVVAVAKDAGQTLLGNTGVELRRNRMPNPIPANTTGYQTTRCTISMTDGGLKLTATDAVVGDYPNVRITWQTGGLRPTVTAGESVVFSYDSKSSDGISARTAIRFYNSSGSQVSEVIAPSTSGGSSEFSRGSQTAIVPSSAVTAGLFLGMGDTSSIGDTIVVRNLYFGLSGTYFDGSTPPSEDGFQTWAGTPNASESIQYAANVATSTAVGETLRVEATDKAAILPGYWDMLTIVEDEYIGPAFGGNSEPFWYRGESVYPFWDGEHNNSTSSFHFYDLASYQIPNIWNQAGKKFYEAGVDRVVMYLDSEGVAWSGVTSINESITGADPQPVYVDGLKTSNRILTGDFEATLEAYGSPEEFGRCDGTVQLHKGLFVTQQSREQFDFTYRTLIGNDVDGTDHGYKIHIVYNAFAEPSDVSHTTLSLSMDPVIYSWDITTIPNSIPGAKPTSHVVIDSRKLTRYQLTSLEATLYGTKYVKPRMPSISELIELLED